MADRPEYVYVTYIQSTPEAIWHAITDPETSGSYWGHRNVSDWQPGSGWEHQRLDGSGADAVGTVLEAEPPRRLVMTFAPPDGAGEDPSRVTITLERHEEIVRLTLVHDNLADEAEYQAIASGWPAVLANLKSLLETGHALPQAPWEMGVASA